MCQSNAICSRGDSVLLVTCLFADGPDALVGRHNLASLPGGGAEGQKGAVHAGVDADGERRHLEQPLHGARREARCLPSTFGASV